MKKNPTRILIITQNDPFYLEKVLPVFFEELSVDVVVLGAIVLAASPFGKKESFYKKSYKTWRIFGLKFFIYYALKFIISKIRGSSIKKIFKERKVELLVLHESVNSDDSLRRIREINPDVIVSILGNEIFKSELLKIAPCFNLHTAYLPKYRGLMPTFWVLKNNEEITGVSVFLVDEGIDSGLIIKQQIVDLSHHPTQAELIFETKFIGMKLMAQAVNEYAIHGKVSTKKNNNSNSSYFGFPTRKDVKDFLASGQRFF